MTAPLPGRRWPLKVTTVYRAEGFSEAEIIEEPPGGADTFGADRIVAVIIADRPGGGVADAVLSVDGPDGKGVSPAEMFRAWVTMASVLIGSLPPGGRRELCSMVLEMTREALASIRPTAGEEPS